MGVLGDVTRLFVEYVDSKARQYTASTLDDTRRVGIGLVLLAGSLFFWVMGLQFAVTAVFFRLAPGLERYAAASFYAGLVPLAVALGLTIAGRNRLLSGRRRGIMTPMPELNRGRAAHERVPARIPISAGDQKGQVSIPPRSRGGEDGRYQAGTDQMS